MRLLWVTMVACVLLSPLARADDGGDGSSNSPFGMNFNFDPSTISNEVSQDLNQAQNVAQNLEQQANNEEQNISTDYNNLQTSPPPNADVSNGYASSGTSEGDPGAAPQVQAIEQGLQSFATSASSGFDNFSLATSQTAQTLGNDLHDAMHNVSSDGTNSSGYWSHVGAILVNESVHREHERLQDPQNVDGLDERQGLATDALVALVKILPVQDPDTGKIVTMDTEMRKMTSDPALAGSDLQRDPLRTGTLLLVDSDYLMEAKIIPGPDGEPMSLTEAETTGYGGTETQQAMHDYAAAKAAYDANDSATFDTSMQAFAHDVQGMNEAQSASGGGLGTPAAVVPAIVVPLAPPGPPAWVLAIPGAFVVVAGLVAIPPSGTSMPRWMRRW
ncbi:MAG: hypothetical protein ACYDDF_12750 [Thermoplasmatota archaeon]